MNFGDILQKLLHFFHIFGNGDSTGTNVTTYKPFSTTFTPVIIDTSTLAKISQKDGTVTSTIDPDILSSINYHEHPTENNRKTSLVTGFPGITDVNITDSTNGTTTSETTVNTSDQTNSTESDSTTSSGNSTTTNSTESTVTEESSTSSNATGETDSSTATTTPSGNSTTTTANSTESTVTGESSASSNVTEETDSSTATTTPSGNSTTTNTITEGSSTVTVPPTAEPKGLSRGAVAGIVIGCLLLIAVVAAAIVFFVKNRNTEPEHQRLRV